MPDPIAHKPYERLDDVSQLSKKLYFINEEVEWDLSQYIWTGCTDARLRNNVMIHASELIRQIIRKQGLHTIYPGQEESAFGDLMQVAWCQLERVIYKYRSRPHCRACFNPAHPSDSILYEPDKHEYGIICLYQVVAMYKECPKCGAKLKTGPAVAPSQGRYGGSESILYRGASKVFNMWSQVARTVILAYIKKEGRDRKNSGSYVNHLGTRHRQNSDAITRFFAELRQLWPYHDDYHNIIDNMEWLILNDDKPHDTMISKLIDKTGLSRNVIVNFLTLTKLRSAELSDSNLNRFNSSEFKIDHRKVFCEFESDD